MLNKMIGTFIRRPVFTTMFVLLLVVFGIKSYPNLGVDLYPDVELPLVSVTVIPIQALHLRKWKL